MNTGKFLTLIRSASDAETMRAAAEVLSGFVSNFVSSYGIPREMTVATAA
jgi:hypothetical protein